jgi:transcriptional regulator with XRE-family HTH domain
MEETLLSVEYELLIKLLRTERITRGVTQAELAKRMDLAQTTISAYENLYSTMDINKVRFMAIALGIDFVELMIRWETEIDNNAKKHAKKKSSVKKTPPKRPLG